jgi:hypothetical protein
LGSRSTRGNLEQTRKLINLEKGLVMSRRAIISLAASVVVGIVSIATMSTDASRIAKAQARVGHL